MKYLSLFLILGGRGTPPVNVVIKTLLILLCSSGQIEIWMSFNLADFLCGLTASLYFSSNCLPVLPKVIKSHFSPRVPPYSAKPAHMDSMVLCL